MDPCGGVISEIMVSFVRVVPVSYPTVIPSCTDKLQLASVGPITTDSILRYFT